MQQSSSQGQGEQTLSSGGDANAQTLLEVPDHRQNFPQIFGDIDENLLPEDISGEESKPYYITIEKLKEMQWIQCPIQKLNHIYTCLKFDLAQEIDEFYGTVSKQVQSHLSQVVKNQER